MKVYSFAIFTLFAIICDNLSVVGASAGLVPLESVVLLGSVLIVTGERIRGERATEQIKSKVIDEILKKAEEEKAKKKESANSNVGELDPIKCFPKALCGVSSEVEQISKRKKNGLITEYLVLMKAVAKHPEVLEDVISSKNKGKDKDEPNDDEGSESEEDDEDYSDEEADDEPSYNSNKNNNKNNKPPQTDEEFHKAYLKEKLEMEMLFQKTMQKEDKDEIKWGDEYPFKRRPNNGRPPPHSGRPNNNRPPPSRPWGFGGGGNYNNYQQQTTPNPFAGPRPRPYFRIGETISDVDSSSSSGTFGGIKKFVKSIPSLLGFGESSLTNDAWFPSAARDLSGEVAPGLAVDETREILETAIDIGKSFEKPSQCNEIFNACQYDYTELLYVIDDLRKSVRKSVEEVQSDSSKVKSKGKKKNKEKSELISTKTSKKTKSKDKGGKKSSVSEVGDVPERYVIQVTPPPQSSFADSFSFPNVLSWLGL